jgi:hypothetical protein
MQISADRYTNEYNATPLADGSFVFAARGIGFGQWWRHGRSHIDESELWQKNGEQYSELTPRGAKQLWPMVTADGSRTFFVSDRNGSQNIWTMAARTVAAKQLTNFTDGRVLWANLFRRRSRDRLRAKLPYLENAADWRKKPLRFRSFLEAQQLTPIIDRVNASTQNPRARAFARTAKRSPVIARGEVFAAVGERWRRSRSRHEYRPPRIIPLVVE